MSSQANQLPTQQTDLLGHTGSELCASCGLCCDGTIFSLVPLRPDDALPPLHARGITIVTRNAVPHIGLPCSALRDRCCQIYPDRPSICRSYRCRVLSGYEHGRISWSDARARVDRARTLKETFAAALDRLRPGSPAVVTNLAGIVPNEDALAADPDLRRAWAPVLLPLAALLHCLRTHFTRPSPPTT